MKINDSGNSTIASIFWKFGERITAQLVSTIVAIVLARILTPDDYGVVALVTIVISVCNAFVTGGFGNALIQKRDSDHLDFSSLFYVGFLFSEVLYIILFFLAVPIANAYENSQLIWIIRVMSLRLPIASINTIQHAFLAKKMQFKRFFFATLIGTVVSAAVGICMAINGFGVWALVAQYLTNVAVDTIVLFVLGGWRPKLEFSLTRTKQLLPYGFKVMGAAVLDAVFQEIRSFIISAKYSTTDLAMYENGKKYPNLIVININASIQSVLFPVMSKQQESREGVKRIMKQSIKLCTFCLAPILIGLFSCSYRFVDVVLTSKWLDSVPFMRMMCVMCLFYPIHTVNIQALNAIGESGLTMKLEVIKKAVNISLLLVTMYFGVTWIAIGAMAVSLLSTYINAAYGKKQFNYSFIEQLKDIMPFLTLSIVMAAVIMIFDRFVFLPGILMLIFEILIGVFIYVGGSILFHIQELSILKQKAQKLFQKKQEV